MVDIVPPIVPDEDTNIIESLGRRAAEVDALVAVLDYARAANYDLPDMACAVLAVTDIVTERRLDDLASASGESELRWMLGEWLTESKRQVVPCNAEGIPHPAHIWDFGSHETFRCEGSV